jgi:hypothetical protein
MLLQAVIGACLEALEDFSVGSLNLSITLWMRNRCIVNFDAKILAISSERVAGELRLVVGDDPVQDPKPADNGLDKLDYGLLVDLDHRAYFWPLGELVNGDIHIPKSTDGAGERT